MGVQIFLCMSGFLYGGKRIGDEIDFYIRRLKRILIPYYIILIIMSLIQLLYLDNVFDIYQFGLALIGRGTIEGGEHLWYVPTILMCYFLTPLLEKLQIKYVRSYIGGIKIMLLTSILFSVYFGVFANFYNPAWITCYVLGYFIGAIKSRDFSKKGGKWVVCIFAVLTIVGNGTQIYVDYIGKIKFSGVYHIIYNAGKKYNHVLLGVGIYTLLYSMFSRIHFKKMSTYILKIVDDYSYEIYLVHQFFILGPLSLLCLTSCMMLNILIAIICIIVAAFALKRIETLFFMIIENCQK